MNRTQYEAVHGKQVKEPCKMCLMRRGSQTRIRRLRHKARKALAFEKAKGIESGKVINLFDCDEITGWHYRVSTDMYTGQGSE